MNALPQRPSSIVPPLWQLLPGALLVSVFTVAVFYGQQTYLPVSEGLFLGALVAMAALSALLFGPSRLVLTLVFVYALTGHAFRSVLIVPFGGVEWHPRELLLLLLFAHGVIKIAQRRVAIQWSPLHMCMMLYSAVFVYAAWRGLWLGNDPQAIIAELRAPLFLGAFWVFAACIRRPGDLQYYGYLALCVVTLMALATLAFFAWASFFGPIPNTQNALGEFVPRAVGGWTLQSVRPSGHLWFECGLVLCVGMFWCPREPWYRRCIYVGLGLLFTGAIAVGMMRTAWISVLVSLLVLAWLNLPRPGKGLVAGGVALLAVLLMIAFGLGIVPTDGLALGRSIDARYVEASGALDAMKAHPFFGAGLGASFEALGLANQTGQDSAIPTDYDSLHNFWLYLAWKGGLVGLAVALLAITGMLLYTQGLTNRLPTMNQRCFARCLMAVLVGQLVASLTMPRLGYGTGALFLGVWLMGVILLKASMASPQMALVVNTPPADTGEDDGEIDDIDENEAPAPIRPASRVSSTLEQC